MNNAFGMKLRIFLFMGLGFAGLNQGFDYLQGHGFMPWKFLFNMVGFGGLMTLMLWKSYKKQLQKNAKEFNKQNLNVYQEEIIQIRSFSKENLLGQIKSSPVFSKSKIEETDLGFKLITPITWKSWGEIILVEILPEEENEQNIRIVSYPAMSSTIMDYGKNLKNVENLKRIIEAA